MVSHREPLHVDTSRASHWQQVETDQHMPTSPGGDARNRQPRHLRRHSVPVNAESTLPASSTSSSANPVSPVGLGLLSGMGGIGIAGSISRPPFPPPTLAPTSARSKTTRQSAQGHQRRASLSKAAPIMATSAVKRGKGGTTARGRRNTVATGVPSIPLPNQFLLAREARSVAYKDKDIDNNDEYDDYEDNDDDDDDTLSSSTRDDNSMIDEDAELDTPLSSFSSFSFRPQPKSLARRSSLSSYFIAGAGKDEGPDLLDLSDHLRSRAGRSTSFGNGLPPVSPTTIFQHIGNGNGSKQAQQDNANTAVDNLKPRENEVKGEQMKGHAVKAKPKLDYFQERILRGDFMD